MGILMITTTTIPKSFQIIICHRSNVISKSFFSFLFPICILLFVLHPFNVFVYLYRVVNFSSELDFHSHFAQQIKNIKNINETK